jgi:hypothetical protein
MYYVVQALKKPSKLTIVREECLIKGIKEHQSEQEVYIGKNYDDKPPQKVLKTKAKNTCFSGPGVYWMKILSIHGKYLVKHSSPQSRTMFFIYLVCTR